MSRADTLALNDQKVHDLVLRGTPAKFDNSEALATTEFVQRALGSYATQVNYTKDTVLTGADVGRLVHFPQLSVATMPLAKDLPPGALITIHCSVGGPVTVKPQGTDGLLSLGSGPAPEFKIQAGTYAVFRRLLLGDSWCLDGGDVALQFSPVMSGKNWVTQPQFTSDKSFATTEFVRRQGLQYSSITLYSVSTVLTADSAGGQLIAFGNSATIKLTLPAASTFKQGATLSFLNSSNEVVTITAPGTDKINPGNNAIQSVTLQPGDSFNVVLYSTVWECTGGSAQLAYLQTFASSLGGSGYQRLPSGKLEQWGSFTAGTTPSTFTFPIAFKKAVHNVQVSASVAANIGSATLTGIPITAVANGVGVYVFAIGE